MAGTELFAGGFLNAVDAKGRVSLPASFRDVVERNTLAVRGSSEKVVLIGEHPETICLEAFDNSYQTIFKDEMERRLADGEPRDRMRALEREFIEGLGSKYTVKFDDAGRMVLPQSLRQWAEIEDVAWFISAGERFLIWSPEQFRAANADAPRALRALDRAMAERRS